ncbi:MAG TPA: glycosyltransferase family 39 protein, partial [Oceanospirillales bacterium]|nr:glycosyltransferase family 39 protein [Oceanospirillales bacterium]
MPLNKPLKKSSLLYLLLISAIVVLQIVLLSRLQLFGDEAFYYLEGQHLALSYAELPAFTAWMIRLGTTIFGKHYFAVRSVSFLAYLAIFYCIYLLNDKKNWLSASSLVFAIPLFMLIAVMALPDIWLLFFVMWLIYFLKKVLKTNKNSDWLILGILTALSLNVHVRMWIWLFFAGVSFLFFFRDKKFLKPIALIFIPVTAIGIIPILLFNSQHDYALFAFQFGHRNPWQFQFSNISFVLSQLLVITPFVLFVWFKCLTTIKQMM